ncbi:uncharacterized protein BDW43DRAFT_268164 [Aspergillus alliaceus]|uniref:uncharacterized protein n=1 Tax=Petromyces alliaceus TaxID=209559 RepID=UPI0012A4DC28|nr:uncharacterized protein BDW43DRAFT_268164 [Aspergillus alliaceus]KAB8236324.1 hypothetical protein BDW43DRAFT_268164 [Aspergillus alliaceus]
MLHFQGYHQKRKKEKSDTIEKYDDVVVSKTLYKIPSVLGTPNALHSILTLGYRIDEHIKMHTSCSCTKFGRMRKAERNPIRFAAPDNFPGLSHQEDRGHATNVILVSTLICSRECNRTLCQLQYAGNLVQALQFERGPDVISRIYCAILISRWGLEGSQLMSSRPFSSIKASLPTFFRGYSALPLITWGF